MILKDGGRKTMKKGFSLVELMILVAIMAILTAIAIPSYLNFQITSKESGMKSNMKALQTKMTQQAELATEQEWQELDFPPTPEKIPGTKPVAWPGGASWDKIEFKPDKVRYQYEIDVQGSGGSERDFTIYARGDVDGDGIEVTWTLAKDKKDPTPDQLHVH